ncbi:MAG: hypothetical protein HOB32_01650 [Nitrospina sp.]|jgi:hypothetical protein|nr:hypothetical protein [Nitrospina sp.]
MSLKYYLVSGIIVVILTIIISWWEQKKSLKEIFFIFCRVIALTLILIFAMASLSELLVYLGVAQDGFILKQEELK